MKEIVCAVLVAAACVHTVLAQGARGAALTRSAFFGSPTSSLVTYGPGTLVFRLDAAGNRYILWAKNDILAMAPHQGTTAGVRSFVTKISPDDRILWEYSTVNERLTGLTVDSARNVTVVGDGIPVGNYEGFVRRIDTRGDSANPPALWTVPVNGLPSAIASDADGNLYITGVPNERFQATAGAAKSSAGPANCYVGRAVVLTPCADAFVLKLSADGQRTVYATWLGGSLNETASDIAVGPDGSAYVVGETTSQDFPTTTGAAQPTYGGGTAIGPLSFGDGFAVRVDPSGRSLLYSTFIGAAGPDRSASVAVDPATGNALVGGYTETLGPAMPGANPADAVVTLLAAGGNLIRNRRIFTANVRDGAVSTSISPDGRLFIGTSGTNEIVELNRDTLEPVRRVMPRTRAVPAVIAGPSGVVSFVTVGGDWKTSIFAVPLGQAPSHGAVYTGRYDFDDPPRPGVTGVVNAASYAQGRRFGDGAISMAPNEIVTIFGEALPSPERVSLSGRDLRVLYQSESQINVLVPAEVPAGSAELTIQSGGAMFGPYPVEIARVVPGFFTIAESLDIAAVNQDGTINSREHPAPAGSIVALFATGLGRVGPSGLLVERLSVYGAGGPGGGMEVLYAGEAPGLPGVQQVNVRVYPYTPSSLEPLRAVTRIVFDEAAGFETSQDFVGIWVAR